MQIPNKAFLAETVQHILKTITLYNLELDFDRIPNKQHDSYTRTEFHVFIEIHNDLTFLPVFTFEVCIFKICLECV